VAAWQAFAAQDSLVPYLIFTALPDGWRLHSQWRLRYSGVDSHNTNRAKRGA
jgi:hypothetical protein